MSAHGLSGAVLIFTPCLEHETRPMASIASHWSQRIKKERSPNQPVAKNHCCPCYIIVTSLLHHCYIIVTSLLHCLSDHPSTELGILMPRMPRLGVYMGIPSTKDVRHWAPSACERMPSSPVIKLLVVFCLESAYGIVVLMGFRLGPTEIERPLEPG